MTRNTDGSFGAGTVLRNFVTFIAYSAAALLAKWYFSRHGFQLSPFWLPAGFALFAAMTSGWRIAPGIFFGSVLAEILVFGSHSWPQSLLISASNTIAPLLAAALFRLRSTLDDPFSSTPRAYYFLAVGVIVHGALAATGGTLSLLATLSIPPEHLPAIWLRWAMSDGGGTLLVTPILMMGDDFTASFSVVRRNWIEWLICVGIALTGTIYLAFGVSGIATLDAGATFLVMLPLLWSAARFPLCYSYALMVGVMMAAIVSTLAGHGPLVDAYRERAIVTFSEMAIGFSAAVLLLGAALNEQRLAKEALHKANLELESRVDSRTAELLESRRTLEQMAFFDTLTGLGNRRMFEDRFEVIAAMVRRKREKFALAMVDLDRFKDINDRHGHDAGDALLQEAARRLSASVRAADSVARLGGDEFGIVLGEAKSIAAIDLVCQRIVESFVRPIRFGEIEMNTSASIGLAMFPDHGTTRSELYKAADLALYEAKHGGRNTWRWFRGEIVGDTAPSAAMAAATPKSRP
jgi:diguanylate cyclase (GGDEF)-like protein